jgi:hypothetical protein
LHRDGVSGKNTRIVKTFSKEMEAVVVQFEENLQYKKRHAFEALALMPPGDDGRAALAALHVTAK